MVVFLLAATLTYLAFVPAADPPPAHPVARKVGRRRLILFVLLITVGLILFAQEIRPLDSSFEKLRRVASAPETVQALLGALAGVMFRALPRWQAIVGGEDGRGRPDRGGNAAADGEKAGDGLATWPLLIFSGAFFCVVLAALLAPIASKLLDRLSGVEIPNLKVQFATSAVDRQLVLKVDRDLVSFDKLEGFPQSIRFIQFDCGQKAAEAGGIDKFTTELKFSPEYEKFRNALAFRSSVLGYINYVINLQRAGYSMVLLKQRVATVADKFALLAAEPQDFAKTYEAAWSEMESQNTEFSKVGAALNPHVSNAPQPEEDRRTSRDPDPTWCKPNDPMSSKIPVNADSFKSLLETRYVYGFISGLYNFIGNGEADLRMLNLAKANLPNDINVNSGLGAALYLGGEDFHEIFSAMDDKMSGIATLVTKSQREFDAVSPRDQEMKSRLDTRYKRASFMDKVNRAYLWAQQGLDDVWPLEQVPWQTALKYAKDAYLSLPEACAGLRYCCIDDDWELRINDAYAYVSLAFEAHKVQVEKKEADQSQVRNARWILEDLRAKVLDMERDTKRARERREAAQTCLIEAETKAWKKRIANHLNLADALR